MRRVVCRHCQRKTTHRDTQVVACCSGDNVGHVNKSTKLHYTGPYTQMADKYNHKTHTHTHTTVLLLFWNMSETTRVSRYQKGKTRQVKTNLDLLEQEILSGSGICWAICNAYSLRPPARSPPAGDTWVHLP